jgi:hypothetical protein
LNVEKIRRLLEPAFEAYVDKRAFITGIASSNTMPAKIKRMIKTF